MESRKLSAPECQGQDCLKNEHIGTFVPVQLKTVY